MENNRVTPRIRPRPYDLRRKVLLKNFLREQMTYIPPSRSLTEASLEVNNDLNFNENLSNSINNENILTPKNEQDNVVSSTSAPDPIPSTSTCNEKENSNNLNNFSSNQSLVKSVVSEVEKMPSTKFSRLSNLLTMKRKRKKCITKAKHDTKAVKSIHKPFIKVNKDTESSIKEKPKQFFTMFKLRREKKRNKMSSAKERKIFESQSANVPQVTTTSNQSVQTDLSWSREEYDRMEQSKREEIESLREENRMLSESLSNMISDSGSQFNSRKSSFCTDSYVDNANNFTMFSSPKRHSIEHDYADQSQQIDSSRTRVLRSKSMQEKCIKRNLATSRLRTRSMNRGYNKRERLYDTNSFSTNESYSTRQKYFRAGSTSGYNSYSAKVKPAAVSNSNCNSNSSNVHGSLVLKTLPSDSGKALVRRSSMPERTCTWNQKPFHSLRSNSVRENNRGAHRSRQTTFRSVQPPYRRKPSLNNGYIHLPFQDLPPEAFY